jgi:hypothetical protein
LLANTGGLGVFLRDTPNGEIITALSEGTPVQILYRLYARRVVIQ